MRCFVQAAFVYGLVVVLLAGWLAGCKDDDRGGAGPVVRTHPGYGEAASLAARVQAGTLPPVEERLPGNPLVVTPVERLRYRRCASAIVSISRCCDARWATRTSFGGIRSGGA